MGNPEHSNRRSFLRRTILGVGAAALVRDSAASNPAVDTRPADAQPLIEMLPLGKTGVKVSRLAMGGSFLAEFVEEHLADQ